MIKLVENRKIEKKQTYGIYSNIQIQRFNKKKKIIKGKACLEKSKRAMMEQNPKKRQMYIIKKSVARVRIKKKT